MKSNLFIITVLVFSNFIFCTSESGNYVISEENGVRVVDNLALEHNKEMFKIEHVKTYGELEGENEYNQFYLPGDFAFDDQGLLYIVDTGNFRVQVLSQNGEYVRTIGREGQGPGEFSYPIAIDIFDNKLFVLNDNTQTLIKLDMKGKYLGEQKLKKSYKYIKLVTENVIIGVTQRWSSPGQTEDPDNRLATPPLYFETIGKEEVIPFGEAFRYGKAIANAFKNNVEFTVKEDKIYSVYSSENSIQRCNMNGDPELKISRKLMFENEIPEIIEKDRQISFKGYIFIAKAVDIDSRGNIWVVTNNRQMKDDEKIIVGRAIKDGKVTTRLDGTVESIKTDIFKLEIFSNDGILLQEIPLDMYCDKMKIFNDRLYILDTLRGMCLYEYRIVYE